MDNRLMNIRLSVAFFNLETRDLMLNSTKLRELYYRVLAEAQRPLPQADMMYLVSETRSNQASVLDRASEFSGPIGIVGYPDTESRVGYPGSDVWVPELVKRGISRECIVLIVGSFVDVDGKNIIHTLSEMQALVRHAKIKRIQKIVLVAPQFHILRSFMCGVHALTTEHYPELRLYPALGTTLDWNEASSHSQGTLKGIRADFLVEETIRIYTYHEKGNLPAPEDVLAYLDRRDAT